MLQTDSLCCFDNATVNIWQHTCAFTTHEIRHLVVLLWICKYKEGRGLLIIAKETLYYNELIKEKIDYFLKSMRWRLCESANKIRESLQSGSRFCWFFFFNLITHLFYSWEMNYDICFASWEMNDIHYAVLLVCRYNGKIYKVGQSFPAVDGCNTCSCSSNGRVRCTLRACVKGKGNEHSNLEGVGGDLSN